MLPAQIYLQLRLTFASFFGSSKNPSGSFSAMVELSSASSGGSSEVEGFTELSKKSTNDDKIRPLQC